LFWHGKKKCYSAQAFLKKAKKKSKLKLLTWLSLTNLNNLNNTNKTKYNDNKQIDKKKYEARLSNNSILKRETKKKIECWKKKMLKILVQLRLIGPDL
jgi:hypothetical protein